MISFQIFIDFLSRPLLLHGLIKRILGPKRPTSKWKKEDDPLDRNHQNDNKSGHREDFQLSRDEVNGQSAKDERNITKSLVTMDERILRLEAGTSGRCRSSCQDEGCDYNYISNEWKMVSAVMDRLFFVLYITALVLSAVIFFPRPNENALE